MKVEAYLFFNGRCEEAIEFYKTALGAQVEMMLRFHDMPTPHEEGAIPPGMEDKIMHASLRIGDTLVMASDGNCADTARFDGFSLHIEAPSNEKADQLFHGLAENGTITMPLEKTFWSPYFGMVTDRFGVNWMVDVAVPA